MYFLDLLFLAIGIFGNPCNLKAYEAIPAANLTQCLRTVHAPQSELHNFIQTMIEYVNSTSYFYLYMDGPAGQPSYDTMLDLKKLQADIPTKYSGSGNFYAFCEQIHLILTRLKDCRVGAGYPFLQRFAYFLPFAFTSAGDGNLTHLQLIPNGLSSLVYSEDEIDGLADLVATDIDFRGGGSTYIPAGHAVSQYSLDQNDYTRDPHAAYNFVIKGYFTAVNGNYLFRPEERYSPIMKVKAYNRSAPSVEIVIDAPWYGTYTGRDYEGTDFETLSPKKNTSASKRHFNSNFKKRPQQGLRPSAEVFPPHRLKAKNVTSTSVGKKKSSSSRSYFVKSAFDKMMEKRRLPIPSTTTSSTKGIQPNAASVHFEELYSYNTSEFVNCRVLLDEFNKIGYVLFLEGYRFDDVDHPKEFYQAFGKAFRQMVDRGAENLVIDMRGHEGGYVSVFEAFFDFILHDTVYPRGSEQDVVKSPSNNEVIRFFQKFPEKMGLDFSEWEPMIKHYDDETVTKVHLDRTQFPPKPFTAEHSTRVYCEECIPSGIRDAYGGYSPFDAQHLYIVTDGDCFGGCTMMTLQALELNAARVLGYGWNPEYENNYLSYAPGSCTGTYWGSDIIEYLTDELDEQNTFNRSNLPKPWERDDYTIYFCFSHFEDFNRNPARFGESLVYSNATVHEILPFQVYPGDLEIESMEEIASKIIDLYVNTSYCFAGEVLADAACQNADRNALHQRYGRPCDTIGGRSSFNHTECIFAGCERYYYLNGTHLDGGGICIPIPGEGPTPPKTKAKKEKMPGWGAALVVFVVLFFVIIVALVAYIVYINLNKSQSYPLRAGEAPTQLLSLGGGPSTSTSFHDDSPPVYKYPSTSSATGFSDVSKKQSLTGKEEDVEEEEEEVEDAV